MPHKVFVYDSISTLACIGFLLELMLSSKYHDFDFHHHHLHKANRTSDLIVNRVRMAIIESLQQILNADYTTHSCEL